MRENRVSFLTTAGGRFGMGHLSRCGSIARHLMSQGAEVQVVLGTESKMTERERLLGEVIHRLDSDLSVADGEGNWFVHPNLLAKLKDDRPDAVFIDSYETGMFFQSTVGEICDQTIVIDDQLKATFACDHLINYAPTVSETDYLTLIEDRTRLHLGLDFFPVSEALRQQKANTNRENYLAVCLGGSGCGETTRALVRQLKQCEIIRFFGKIVVINGLTPVDQHELKLGKEFQVIEEPANFSEIIGNARVAITGAGVSALERVYLETPGVITATADNQRPNFRYLTDRNIFTGYSLEDQSPQELNRAIEESIDHRIGNDLIDGRGTERISTLLRGDHA